MKKLFSIGNKIPKRSILIIELIGLLFFIFVWYILTMPRESRSIQFTSSAPADCSYEWKGPNGFFKSFSGDNLMTKIKPGTYYFTVKDSSNCEITDSITVPDKIKEAVIKDFQDASYSDTLNLTIEIKSIRDGFISRAVIPPPIEVVKAFRDLHFTKEGKVRNDTVIIETGYSLFLNILGYIEAILISIFFGFLIGLVPFFRALLSRWVNAVRFVPLTAVTGLFIAWFGIESNMKVQFLAFGIFVYLLPVIVQRIDEVQKIYLQTAYTLGATKWQLIKTVYFPSVASKVIDDIRVLTAISWTYIIIAEMLNQTGGIGALIHLSGRQSRLDKVFALLIIIVIIGILQDRLFAWLDKKIFKFKYQGAKKH